MTVTELLRILPAERFLRVHKSYIVAIDAILKIERHQLVLPKITIPIGESYRESVERLLLG
ncbi:LytTR family DNA-binding domain-containing protein [Runella zeae]|nr:LytTR family DNA-binding domain-containing protein [Runella zeae]